MSRDSHQRISLLVFDPRDPFGIAIDCIAHHEVAGLHIEELPVFSHPMIGELSLGESACQHIEGGMNTPGVPVLAHAFEVRSISQQHSPQPFAHQPRDRTRSDFEHFREHPGQPGTCLPKPFAPIGL